MRPLAFHAGLTPRFPSPPPEAPEDDEVITDEAGVRAPFGESWRVTPLVEEGALVGQGAPLACLRDAPEVRLVAPMPGRVARISLQPGRKLSEIVLFHEAGGDIAGHDFSNADSESGLRHLMQSAGFWPWLNRRPFGGMPDTGERSAAIVVMAADTRPFAPDPRDALEGRREAFERGLAALARLTDGPVLVLQQPGAPLFGPGLGDGRVRPVDCGPRHPQGSPGIQIHGHFPAGLETPVWTLHAEDAANLGDLVGTGRLPMTRQVRVAGTALCKGRLVRTQCGADLRQLTRRVVSPGPHVLMSGSPLDGHTANWLAPRHRQVTVLPRPETSGKPHWLVAALTRSGTSRPVIPSAALSQSLGAALPAAAFVRALSAGDDETAVRMGVLSLLEEDLALADYILGGDADLKGQLRRMLDQIRQEQMS